MKGTNPTQIRLTEDDKSKIEDIRVRFGLPSMAAAIRYAIETAHRQLGGESPPGGKARKKRPPAR